MPSPMSGPPAGGPRIEGPKPEEEGGEAPSENSKPKEATEEEIQRDRVLLDYLVSIIRKGENDKFTRLESLKPYFDLTAMEACQKVDTDSDKQITRDEIPKRSALPSLLRRLGSEPKRIPQPNRSGDRVLLVAINYQRMQQTIADDNNERNSMKFVFKKEPAVIFAYLDRNGDNSIDTTDARKGMPAPSAS